MNPFTNLGDLIDRDLDLDKIAIIDFAEGGERRYSFRALDAMSNGVARALNYAGLRRGERVAILSANRAEYLATYYGIMRAGLVAVPINYKFPRELVDFVMCDSGSRLLFCDAQRKRDYAAVAVPTVCFGESGAQGFDAFLNAGAFAARAPAPDEPAMFLYTSGSTGKPKGVVLSHQSHLWVIQARLAGQILEHHRYLIAAPLYHMNALALSQLACAAHASIVLLPQFSARAYIEAIGRHRCTWLTAVPPMIAMMLKESELLARTDLTSVEFLRMGSAPVSPSLLAAIRDALPQAKVTNAYGTTEAGPVVFGPHPDGLVTPELSVGYPHPQVRLRLVSAQGEEAQEGVLQMKCPAVMLGYHNRPDLVPPFTVDGYYVTGDVFRRDRDGFFYFVGRTDDMFVCGGENIYPGEVEKVLERHPGVQQACVVPVADEIKGYKPVAFVVRRPGEAVSELALQDFALLHAPAYQHPRRVWFVEALPLASTNKIDRGALKRAAAQRIGAAP